MDKKVLIGVITLILVIVIGVVVYMTINNTNSQNTNENVNISNSETEAVEETINSEAVVDNQETNNITTTPKENTTSSDKKMLVTYFSWGGTTEKLAQEIANKTGADIARIEEVNKYTTNYDECTEVALEEQRNNARPQYKSLSKNIADYDIIFVGYPIWWMDLPMIMYTFMENENFEGKTIIPFITSYSSGESGTVSKIKSKTSAKEVKDALHIYNRDMDGYIQTVDNWLNNLGL